MNYDNRHNRNISDNTVDRRIDMFLDNYRSGNDVDVERIKILTRDKIRRERLQSRMIVRRHILQWAAVAAIVAVVVCVSFWIMCPVSAIDLSEASDATLAEAGYTTVTVPAGERREITLSDGSVIIANSCTVVKYPAEFDGVERRIFADGEVYCRIAKDADHPFVVESNGFDIRVLGTTFNVRNSSDSTASVVLVEGAVEISTDSHNCVKMRPNHLVDICAGNITSMQSVNPADYTSWIDYKLHLDGEPLSEVIKRLNAFYDLNVTCDSALAGVKIYGKLNLKGEASEVLNSIQTIVPMNMERHGRDVRLRPIQESDLPS